ncbi:MAG: hypothetical protein V4721_10185 [Bacteroidota bacterium]
MNNTPRPRGTYADYLNGDTEGKVFIFELIKNNKNNPQVVSAETGRPVPFPLSVPFPMVGRIFWKDPKSGKVTPRKIRFAEGEGSIFVDEQTPDKDNPKTKVFAKFINGKIQIMGEESVQLKFIMSWDINATKSDRDEKKQAKFFLVDSSKAIAKSRIAHKERFAVEKWCDETELDKVLAVAELKLSSEQMVQPAEDIRFNLSLIAARNPSEFLAMLEDPKTERRYIIKKAIKKGFITINDRNNGVFWSDNPSSPLTVAAPGKDIMEDFIAKSFSGDGERYFEAIRQAVEPQSVVVQEAAVKSEYVERNSAVEPPVLKPEIRATGESEEELKVLVTKAREMGLVTVNKTNVWWKYKDHNSQGEDKLIQALRDNPTMLAIMKSEVLG